MRSLALPAGDPVAVFDAITGAKDEPRRSRLRALRERIVCAYLRYHAHQPELSRLRRLGRRVTPEEADDLRHCYDGMRTIARERFYARILSLSYHCAYCLLGEATTLDHYLPKDGKRGYPEFAILGANLVPACGRCNTPRDFRDAEGRRALIHPYFDAICQERLLFADVRARDGLLEADFHVEPGACSDRNFGLLYERHVQLLKLLPRFRRHAMESDEGLSVIRRAVGRYLAAGVCRADVVALLAAEADDNKRELGANHFKTALAYGVATSETFVDSCRGSLS
jgi:5-methylcytosine-specific restriction endonuclease McrA